MELNIQKMQEDVYEFVKKKKSVYIHGAPGIGKSVSARDIAKRFAVEKNKPYNEGSVDEKAFNFIDLRISQLDPSDLRGIPFPNGNVTKWLIPSWLPTCGEGILFLDEMNLAPQSIQASCYQLVLDRKLGDYRLPDGWAIIGAGNRAIDRASVYPMSFPLKNRFGHIHLLVPTEEEWRNWAMVNNIKADIIAFMAFKPSYLFKIDTNSKDDAFPTPRSWEMASIMTADMDDVEREFRMVAACVGEGVALEYQGFLKLKKKVVLNDILENPKKLKDINEIGLKYSIISGLSEKYRSDRKQLDKILNTLEYMSQEFAVFLLRLMKGANPKDFPNDLTKAPTWGKIYKDYHKFLL